MKKIIFAVLAVLILAVVIKLLNISHEPEKERGPIADRLPIIATEEAPKNMLHPANPQDYGMVVFDNNEGPLSEAEAEELIHKKMQEIKEQFPKETLDKAREKIKEDPKTTEEKIAKIDGSIAKCQQILKDNPYDEAAKNKLQNLLLLKSIAKEMPKR